MYVYLLQSIDSGWRYIGQTQNLQERIKRHNSGQEKSTKRYSPYRLLGYIKVKDRKEALKLERKLKGLKIREYQYKYFLEHGIMETENPSVPGSEK
jgi:putative endonuclease